MDWKTPASALAIGAISIAAQAQSLSPEQKRFHGIYKELVETDTTHSAGDTTLAAQRMARHLRDAGFAEADLQILEPFPRKGNLIARFSGDGSKKPLLLLAHLDVVEALRADWKTDPFVLQESDGFFTARGSIDDKSMAAAFVSILSQLKREGFRPKRDIILALTADEERGDVPSNVVYWLVNNKRAQREAKQRPACGRHARGGERACRRAGLRPSFLQRALQRSAADHLRRHHGARRSRRERPAAIGHGDRQLPYPAARRCGGGGCRSTAPRRSEGRGQGDQSAARQPTLAAACGRDEARRRPDPGDVPRRPGRAVDEHRRDRQPLPAQPRHADVRRFRPVRRPGGQSHPRPR